MAEEDNRSRHLKTTFGSSVKKHRADVKKGKATLSRSKSDIKKSVKAEVSKKLGLTAVGGLGGNSEGYIASNEKGKDKLFYGGKASEYTNEALKKYSGMHLGGNVYSKDAMNIKYGSSGGAMGSGDPSGIMSSIPISKKMQQSQNKFLGLTLAVLGGATPGLGGTVMRAVGAKNLSDATLTSGSAYNEYTQKFQTLQKGKKFTSTRNLFGLLGFDQHGKKTKKDTLGGDLE